MDYFIGGGSKWRILNNALRYYFIHFGIIDINSIFLNIFLSYAGNINTNTEITGTLNVSSNSTFNGSVSFNSITNNGILNN